MDALLQWLNLLFGAIFFLQPIWFVWVTREVVVIKREIKKNNKQRPY